MDTSRFESEQIAAAGRMELELAPYEAAIFDLDGVITDTATVHRAAWKQLFDDHLAIRPTNASENHLPFSEEDYLRYIDGRPRLDGVRAFLESRGIEADENTVEDLGERKNQYFLSSVGTAGLEVFHSTVEFICRLQLCHLRTAVFSASRNCGPILDMAGLTGLFAARVDGVVAAELGLPGKPDPAVLWEATRRIEAEPKATIVVEDARAGVEAARRGGFGLVIGIDRVGAANDLRTHGADVVVEDLSQIHVGIPDPAELEQLMRRFVAAEQTPDRL